jgi:hypothetical protein
MVNSEELIGNTEYLTLYTRCILAGIVINGFGCLYISVCSGQKLRLLVLHM